METARIFTTSGVCERLEGSQRMHKAVDEPMREATEGAAHGAGIESVLSSYPSRDGYCPVSVVVANIGLYSWQV